MNFNDSERIRGILRILGYEPTDNWEEADLILLKKYPTRRAAPGSDARA